MKNSLYFSTILLALVLMVTASCDPTLENEGGRKVKFTASTPASPATKTVYGDLVADGSSTFQFIKWVDGDHIRIFSPDTFVENAGASDNQDVTGTATPWHSTDPAFDLNYWYADYSIDGSTIENSGHKSTASLKNVGGNGLTWSGTGSATFYAAYPDTTRYTSTSARKFCFVPCVPGGNGDAAASIQNGDSAKVANMPLLAMKTVSSGNAVKLDFYPAFSTFEFRLKSLNEALTLQSVELYIDPEYSNDKMWLTGYCYFDLNALSNPSDTDYDSHYLANSALRFEAANSKSLKVNLNNVTISSTAETVITLFTLPCTIDHLCFRVNYSYGSNSYSKMLRMTQNDGWLSFPAGHKAVINGLAVNPDLWCYETLTLEGKVLSWDTSGNFSTASGVNPEASQFAITGVQNVYQQHENDPAYKKYRQTWPLESVDSTATVSFKIMSPRSTSTQNATYTITPQGDYTSFIIKVGETIVTGPWSGNIAATGSATKITFTVTPTQAAIDAGDKKMWFTTSVTAADGTVFNIDSETQLYDMRGYHYFVTKCPCGVVH